MINLVVLIWQYQESETNNTANIDVRKKKTQHSRLSCPDIKPKLCCQVRILSFLHLDYTCYLFSFFVGICEYNFLLWRATLVYSPLHNSLPLSFIIHEHWIRAWNYETGYTSVGWRLPAVGSAVNRRCILGRTSSFRVRPAFSGFVA